MTAFITGITGQAGSYLAEILLEMGETVVGISRRTSTPNTGRIAHILPKITLEQCDVLDSLHLHNLLCKYKPDYIYNLAAQPHVKTSFTHVQSALDYTTKPVQTILEYMLHHDREARFFQASSSEMFGSEVNVAKINDYKLRRAFSFVEGNSDIFSAYNDNEMFQDEDTSFKPRSPYAIAKLAAHHTVRLYRESYDLFACSNIMFNYESPRRGRDYVTRKISWYLAALGHGLNEPLKLGNMNAKRDWGHAKDTMEAAVLSMNSSAPKDYVVGTGKCYSVLDFVKIAFDTYGIDYNDYVEIDQELFRPSEVLFLKADSSLIRRELGWSPKYTFDSLVYEMLEDDKKNYFNKGY